MEKVHDGLCPAARLIGLKPILVEGSTGRMRFTPGAQHANDDQSSILHGGIIGAAFDEAARQLAEKLTGKSVTVIGTVSFHHPARIRRPYTFVIVQHVGGFVGSMLNETGRVMAEYRGAWRLTNSGVREKGEKP